ncbi:MAG: multifunctional oxoglutarate decarboxylase/oxoglutarate dehydrogenase thiamine pyrophosphate-binding subunit/dihydrolipoyllysine-residue succinyltransferase subunit [Chlorobiales bacterium]|jgi:multifunctional 2-oxoglutarate metabolism enzyme|nr:multifunctional oxoglutarate decarboxylase/oxoglutarate dehydrogenase thiamine pyrophosphate-binding subunit/dihydrolipoyllysine-residue succinyltransferase subunit [Chlorobiales bacterium]
MVPLSDDLQEQLVDLFGPNTSFVLDLLNQYEQNPGSVRQSWMRFFDDLTHGRVDFDSAERAGKTWYHDPEDKNRISAQPSPVFPASGNGATQANSPRGSVPVYPSLDAIGLNADVRAVPILGAQVRIVENMEQSLGIPTATSVRSVPVKLLDENRRIINQHLEAVARGKIAFTQIIAWAVVKALLKYPSLNFAFASVDGKSYRIEKTKINFGLAVDLTKKDGSRMLVVPNIKGAEKMNFSQFFDAYSRVVAKAKANKLDPEDFQGTTASLTNPGTLGTIFSMPRLMAGQGTIVATGAIDYATEFQSMSENVLSQLGISKVMNMSNTYDHRIIQGAESGEFLAYIAKLLMGEGDFYGNIFADLNMPYRPWAYQKDVNPALFGGAASTDEVVTKQARVVQMINSYRVRGHLIANVNPLAYEPDYHPELDPEFYGLTIWDLDREFITIAFGAKQKHKLREIIDILRKAYCDKIGIEYMNIQPLDQKQWIQNRVEPKENHITFSPNSKRRILKNLIRAESFERYLHTKFLGHKRFSIEGAETAIAIVDFLIEYAGRCGTKEVVMGMAHRGRINVLANIIGKPYDKLFSEFIGKRLPMDPINLTHGSGDVKYHLGASGVRRTKDGREVKVWLASNPSHLEAVNPVVEGVARAKQDRAADVEGKIVMPILLHGDAAFAGQGMVSETLNLSKLEGYCTRGTIHLVINNQIGFTTSPSEARSSRYATDVAKMVQAPVFHVNGDDPEACIRVARMAIDYRLRFSGDVVIDMLCYRRHGHNEGDDPAYTQPLMYRQIKDLPSVRELYAAQLLREGVLTAEDIESMVREIGKELDDAYEIAKATTEKPVSKADPITLPELLPPVTKSPDTRVPLPTLQFVTERLLSWPEGFTVNNKLVKQFERRRALLGDGALNATVDWAFAESLSFGTILLEGTNVRLSGQDCQRGTFSQRHLSLIDTETGEEYIPLQHLSPDQSKLYAYDSLLSEAAVMGFEYGYSISDPATLVLWEAQFGDFANGAQVIIDQFIVSSESKWGQRSGIVLLLPHGYEGQGPEHSSARLERFLQLCADANMQVCNCTTPAQYFHLLRRHIKAGNIKPLVIMTPKSLLRHPLAVSPVSVLVNDKFHNVLDDIIEVKTPRRIIFCTGKVFYDLMQARQAANIQDVVILRVEQLYPYPKKRIAKLLEKYGAAKDVCWVQEEPKNMGAWTFISILLSEQLENGQKLRYIGRHASSSPAAGPLSIHESEQLRIMTESMALL